MKHGLTNTDVAEIALVHVKTVESWLADKASANHRNMQTRDLELIEHKLPAHLAQRGKKGKK